MTLPNTVHERKRRALRRLDRYARKTLSTFLEVNDILCDTKTPPPRPEKFFVAISNAIIEVEKLRKWVEANGE